MLDRVAQGLQETEWSVRHDLTGAAGVIGLAWHRLAGQMMPEHIRARIGAIRPDDRSDIRVYANLREEFRVEQWLEDARELQRGREIEFACCAIRVA